MCRYTPFYLGCELSGSSIGFFKKILPGHIIYDGREFFVEWTDLLVGRVPLVFLDVGVDSRMKTEEVAARVARRKPIAEVDSLLQFRCSLKSVEGLKTSGPNFQVLASTGELT